MIFDIILSLTTSFSLALAVWCARKALQCDEAARYWKQRAGENYSEVIEHARREGAI